jgi:hypothetical protein
MNMPFDYPRINQFQQWFTPEPEKKYVVIFFPGKNEKKFQGKELTDGLQVKIRPGKSLYIVVSIPQ